MDCREAKRVLFRYLDGELEDDKRFDLVEHLKICYHCQVFYGGQRAFKELICKVKKDQAPEACRESIRSMIDQECCKQKQTQSKGIQFFINNKNALISIAATVVLILLLPAYFILVHRQFVPDLEAMVLQYNDTKVLQMHSNRKSEVEKWLSQAIQRPIAIPCPKAMGVELIGARCCRNNHQTVGLVQYNTKGKNISLFITPHSNKIPQRVESVTVEGYRFDAVTIKEVNIVRLPSQPNDYYFVCCLDRQATFEIACKACNYLKKTEAIVLYLPGIEQTVDSRPGFNG